MAKLNLKPNHKAIRDYYATLQQHTQQGITHEGAVSSPFDTLLHACTKQINATLIPQYPMHTTAGNRIVIDGMIRDEYGLPLAYWEAKDIHDDLRRSVQEKRDAGYPLDNTLFQTPQRAILYQNGAEVLDIHITEPANLIAALQYLFAYVPPALDNWQTAVSDFREHVPDLANRLKELIEQRHETDTAFKKAFTDFYETCRTSINPELSQDAVEEMFIQHILTERIFRTVFNLPHIPFTEDFWGFANAGAQLADLHVNYESAPKYDGLTYIETPDMQIDWRVEKMKLSKDKTQLKYNDFLTIDGIPIEVYDYRLGTRSALEWIIDQYRVKVDRRSGIVNDPNRDDEPRYIVDLIARIITVSLKTVEIITGLPSL